MPQLYTTKEDLTYLADAIRKITGNHEQLTFPDGFIQKIDEIQLYDWEDENWLVIGISSDQFINNNLLSNTYGSFICRLYSNIHYIKGYNIQRAYAASTSQSLTPYAFSLWSKLNEVNFPDCTTEYFSSVFMFPSTENLIKASFPNVTNIWDIRNAFTECQNLKEVNLKNCSAIVSGYGAFQNCYNLEKVDFTNLTYLLSAPNFFAYCSNLKSINLPNIISIGDTMTVNGSPRTCFSMFAYCTQLSNISLPKCKYIYAGSMFKGCSKLKTISLPQCSWINTNTFADSEIEEFDLPSLYTIGSSAFARCSIKTGVFPSCRNVWHHAFLNCKQLTQINFPYSEVVFDSDGYIFDGCENLESISAENCKKIPKYGFYNCTKLKTINIPLCESIGVEAFALSITDQSSQFEQLETIELNNCTTVANSAFARRQKLKNIILPNCNALDNYAFALCYAEYISIGQVSSLAKLGLSKTLKQASFDTCRILNNSGIFQNYNKLEEIFLPQCQIITSQTFENCINLTTININSCTIINSSAFRNCTKLKNINLTSEENNIINNLPNVGNIAGYAFENCEALEEINLPACTVIGPYAFKDCVNLKNVNIELCSNLIYTGIFQNCINLTSIALNSSITSLAGTFQGCAKLSQFSHDNITSIGANTFSNCKALSIISLPNCQSIGISAFNSTKISEAIFPNCTTISSQVFKNCYSLSTVILSQCAQVYEQLFENCIKLKTVQLTIQNVSSETVYLPNCTQVQSHGFYNTGVSIVNLPNCTTLCNEAFMNCFNLTSISLPACTTLAVSVSSVYGIGVFMNCRNLETISLPVCSQICSSAFAGCSKLNKIYLNYNTSVVTLFHSNAFRDTLIDYWRGDSFNSECSARIYVPSTKLSNYKKAQNWALYSNLIYAYDFVNNQEV